MKPEKSCLPQTLLCGFRPMVSASPNFSGRLIPSEDYRLSTLNCGWEDFAVACMRANLRYGKNQRREDVKSHHHIVSVNPRAGPDNENSFSHLDKVFKT